MSIEEISYDHSAYTSILQSRGMNGIKKNEPFWKLKLSEEEYEALKQTLRCHTEDLLQYGIEAALCYAEWWRRDYKGDIPSKEEVAMDIGLDRCYGEPLFIAAKENLRKRGYTFLHSLKGTQYFRTLLNLGGLPVNYITKGNSFGAFSQFLKGLVREMAVINYDWNELDTSIIEQFNCVSYLARSFRNENIYDVSLQIAHAIIMGDKEFLPYDDTDASFKELTKSLETEYVRANNNKRRIRPLSLHWKLCTTEDGQGCLFVNMEVIKDISSDFISGLNISTCYSFDVFVAGTLVGKYVRKESVRDEDGNIQYAIYTRITVGVIKDILWKGEPVVEVKVRCDNDDRLFLTVAGCYPPNFDYPQVFQKLDERLYCMSATSNTENNIAVFSTAWNCKDMQSFTICEQKLRCKEFSKDLKLSNSNTNESVTLTNTFTPYVTEFAGNYISWVEKSNYKLLSDIPTIRVYDKDKNRENNFKVKYKVRNDGNSQWYSLRRSYSLPCGIVDIRVEYPDGNTTTETFYSIRKLQFSSDSEGVFSTDIICSCSADMRPEIEDMRNLEITQVAPNRWHIARSADSNICPSICNFRLYCAGNPVLLLSVAIPFDGVTITDIHGNIVPNGKIVSMVNLANFCIVSHGSHGKKRKANVSYRSDKIEDETKIKHLKSSVIDGLVSLADYNDLITRMFYLYGTNSFDRSSSVVFKVTGTEIFIRKFVLESTIEGGKIRIIDNTEEVTDNFIYKGDVLVFPVGDKLLPEDFFVVKLERYEEADNIFIFPEDFQHKEVVVFSSIETKRRIIPKYYNLEEDDLDKQERVARSSINTDSWYNTLSNEDIMTGKHWKNVCKAFDICSRYDLPFQTYNGLKSIAREPKLLAKFVIAMWINEYKEILVQGIDRFEQELVIAIHWIPAKIWMNCIEELMAVIPQALLSIMYNKLTSLVKLLQEIFTSTISTDIASEFAAYLIQDHISSGKPFSISDIKVYCSKIRGLSDNNMDLPIAKFTLNGDYYKRTQDMHLSYRVMLESAMCAAENTCNVEGHINLFLWENKEFARIVNFYRKYFKETYSDIFLKTVKYITTLNK